jgi:hypothetical protein
MLKTLSFIHGHKWTSMMVKRVYFGNWLRDYSQAVDVGTLKGVQSECIRILIWVLSFLTFGYATGEFEVTAERLGCYRPEEHIDNPRDYADNIDARQYDPRLRPPVVPVELEIDPRTGMKNYIANENLGIATSTGYIKHSFTRSIHFGRVYTSGAHGVRGKEEDLCEALRCLGQGLHCMEDFGAHSNYTELALRELGYHGVFPHTGANTELNVQGKRIFPLVTGTFGAVDFLHSVLGEATDHFTQSEVDEMRAALDAAQTQQANKSRSSGGSSSDASGLMGLLGQVPGAGGLIQQASELQQASNAQAHANASGGHDMMRTNAPANFQGPPGSTGGPPGPGIPGMGDFDPVKTAKQIYPILEFRDKVVKMISATIEKIPGLEALVEKITETLTLFILSLLAPYIKPIIDAVSKSLKQGSSTVVDASGIHQFEVWTNPSCSDPTHSLLSKDHFSNILNEPAGNVACAILKYVAPRILYAWEHPDVPVEQVMDDIARAFHHPALRDQNCEIHRTMFSIVEQWAHGNHGFNINDLLSSEGVKSGKNHSGSDEDGVSHGHSHGGGGHGQSSGFSMPSLPSSIQGPWSQLQKLGQSTGLTRDGDPGEVSSTLAVAYPGTNTSMDGQRPASVEPNGDFYHPRPTVPEGGSGYSVGHDSLAPDPYSTQIQNQGGSHVFGGAYQRAQEEMRLQQQQQQGQGGYGGGQPAYGQEQYGSGQQGGGGFY